MAQGARLILRIQKELKLLLTDPPPGASFPTLSDDSSLTSIDALLQGPERTVYANGVFKIKIQIPERYPFQPPTVTFATPIYHPNIDNGGRICLDILNLPPKGMWQPSLNISTVLTSIGLLLSEPNPDDGLMHEASRDYKYNRQAFDHNARSMTERYARAGETKSTGGSHGTQAHAGQSTSQSEIEGSCASKSITEHRKLSLQSLGSRGNEANGDKDINNVSSHDYAKKHNECEPLKESNHNSFRHTGNPCILKATGKKLSLKVPVSSHHRNGESEKENLGPVSNITSVVSENVMCCNDTGKQAVGAAGKSKMSLKLKDYAISDEVCFRESNAGFKQVDEVESSHTAEAVIVLDSEDESEDEIAPVRSKLSLARRCFSRKRKVASDR